MTESDKKPTPQPSSPKPSSPPPNASPPRGPGWLAILTISGIGIVMLIIGVVGHAPISSGVAKIISLANSSKETTAEDNTSGVGDAGGFTLYTCGMHPSVILPEPGLCPICHMELTPIDPAKFTGEIAIDPAITQSIGVRYEPVKTGPLVRTIRTVGTIDYDETRVRDVNVKVPGWIEKLFVDYLGDTVKEGEPLFDFYSRDMYVAQEEYLLEYRKSKGMNGGQNDLTSSFLDAARTQLEYYDITQEQIEELEQADIAQKTMTIRSPHTGVVIAKHANEGMHVDLGMRVFRIADLSKVWVMVTLYEYQLPFVQEGQTAIMSLPYIPGQIFEGKVIYIYPYLDEKTRQVSVRLEFDNPSGLLKPGMYSQVELKNTLAKERTLVPRAAVIDTGTRQVAFVSMGEGRFEPRDVRLGIESDGDMVEVLDGLKPGEMIVTSGQFLLDSEAKIREGLAKMIQGNLASDQQAVVAVEGASELSSLPPEAEDALKNLLDHYFALGQALSGDTIEGIGEHGREVAALVNVLLDIPLPGHEHFWHQHDEAATIRGEALELIDSADIDEARLHFADLSIALTKLARATGIPVSYGQEVQELHCPMYRSGQGGSSWLQPQGGVRNPFYGSTMLECFDERSAIPVTGGVSESSSSSDAMDSQMDMSGREEVAPPATKPDSPQGVDANAQSRIDRMVTAYLAIQNALTRNEIDEIGGGLGVIRQAASELSSHAEGKMLGHLERILSATEEQPDDLESIRENFGIMSDAMLALVKQAPPSTTVSPAVYDLYCPMVKKHWLQMNRKVANPYDPDMLECGVVKGEFIARKVGDTP